MKKLVSLLTLMSLVLGTTVTAFASEDFIEFKQNAGYDILSLVGKNPEKVNELSDKLNKAKTVEEVKAILEEAKKFAGGSVSYTVPEATNVAEPKKEEEKKEEAKPAVPNPYTHHDSFTAGEEDALLDYKREAIIAVENSKVTATKKQELIKKIDAAKTIEEVKKTVASIKELESLNKVLNNVKASETSSLDTWRAEIIAEIKGLTNITAAMKVNFEKMILKSNDEKKILELAKMARSYVAPAPGSVTASVPANAGGPSLPDAGVNDNLSFFALSSLATATYFILKRKG